MTDQAPAIFVALEASSFAAAIRQSLWLYPAANVGHIIALVFFAGSVAVMDVRLLGGLAATAPGRLLARARWFATARSWQWRSPASCCSPPRPATLRSTRCSS
jgi:hypothetical protein